MGKTLTQFFTKILLAHVKNGIGIPFIIGTYPPDSSYYTPETPEPEAVSDHWTLIKMAQKMEDEWIGTCGGMIAPPNSPAPPSPAPSKSYTTGGTVFAGGVPYEVKWDTKIDITGSAVIGYWVQYLAPVSLGGVSTDMIWYDNRNMPHLIKQVDSANNKILVQGVLNVTDGTGGISSIKSGTQGKISEAMHAGSPTGFEQDFDVTADGCFIAEETVTCAGKGSSILLDSDGASKAYFTTDLIIHDPGDPDWYETKPESKPWITSDMWVNLKNQNGDVQLAHVGAIVDGYTRIYLIPGFDPSPYTKSAPSWMELANPAETSTYVILKFASKPTTLWAVGDTIVGSDSGVTATITADNTDYSMAEVNSDIIVNLLGLLSDAAPKCDVILGPVTLNLPVLVI